MAIDDPHDLTKPRGKQDWQKEPHAIWYPRTTGIWQTVWIEHVGRTYVDKIRWTPHVDTYAIRFEARIGGDPVDDLAVEVTPAPRRAAARPRPLPGDRPRGRSLHRPRRSRASTTSATSSSGALNDPPCSTRRFGFWPDEDGDRRVHVIHGAAFGLDPARPLHAERPALPAADGARSGLLARHADGGAERRCAAEGRRARQGDGLQRRSQAPEDREPALPLLGRPAGPHGLGGNAVCVPLHPHRDQADGARVERGDRARLQPPVHRRLDPLQRIVGRSRADRHAGAATRGRGALPPHQDARRDPAGDRQRRLGEQRDRHHRHPRLRRQYRAPAPALRPRDQDRRSCSTGAVRVVASSPSTATRTAASRSC